MVINNHLIEQSFSYENRSKHQSNLLTDLTQFDEICQYCQFIDENIYYNEDLWLTVEVESGITLEEWLYYGTDEVNEYERSLLLMMVDKSFNTNTTHYDQVIDIALGNYENAIYTQQDYILKRRNILVSIRNAEEFAHFMSSCFINSYFTDDIDVEMRKIPQFRLRTAEIVHNLTVLNDDAVILYNTYGNNLREAIKRISAKVLECTTDPAHKSDLIFQFSYSYTDEHDREIAATMDIECSPHTKLICRNSNLRIYFFWCSSNIANGEKVLIGRIGSHPYKN